MDWQKIFPSWPDEIRENIEKAYYEIRQKYFESNFETSELNGGKFCESVFRLLEWYISGQYRPFGQRINDFKKADYVKAIKDAGIYNDTKKNNFFGLVGNLCTTKRVLKVTKGVFGIQQDGKDFVNKKKMK